MLEIVRNIDLQVLQWIQMFPKSVVLDHVMIFFTLLGNKGIIWIFVSIGLIVSKKYRRVGVRAIAALVLATIIGEGILKHIFQRPRPFLVMDHIELLIKAPTSYSFPSGHTTSSFAVAGVIAKSVKKLQVPVMVLAAFIALSRLYLYVHYPTDILTGMVLGLGCAKLVMKVMGIEDKHTF